MEENQLLLQIIEEIEKADSIVLLRHRKPDLDALGSQLGFSEVIKNTYPTKKVCVVGELPANLSYMGKMDEITQEELDCSLVIITDCSSPQLIQCPFSFDIDRVIKIDHHPNVTPFGKICFVNTHAASVSEFIAEFVLDEKTPFKMNQEAASAFYAGMLGDTGRFLYPSTSANTFKIASKLLEYDVDVSGIADRMITKPLKINRMTGYLYEHLEITSEGMSTIILTDEVLNSFEANDQLASLVVSVPGAIEGVLVWSIFVEQEDGNFRVHLRSKGPIINDIAQEFGGGGHPLACGIPSVTNKQIDEVNLKLMNRVKGFSTFENANKS